MSGHVGDLSSEQQSALNQFRNSVLDISKPEHDDYFLLRWLRARRFDVIKAEAMLRNHIHWRKKIRADSILTEYENPEVMLKYVPYGFLGFDKGGAPVRVCLFGEMDMKGLVLSITRSQAVKCITKMLEEDVQMMKKQNAKQLGKVIETHSYIFDMQNFTLKQLLFKPVYRMAGLLLKCYEANYPEHLKTAYFINGTWNVRTLHRDYSLDVLMQEFQRYNLDILGLQETRWTGKAPPYFSIFFALMKAVFPEETVMKFKIFPTGVDWKESLLQDIDADVLPVFLGGTRVDPDGNPRCPSVINPAREVPESYYLRNVYRNFPQEPGVISAIIQCRSTHPVEMTVPHPGSEIQWEFLSGNHDIGVGLYYKSLDDNKKQEGKMEELIPTVRKNTNVIPGIGSYLCNKKGTYVLQFDNSYSWLNKKELNYRVKIVPPKLNSDINENNNI